MSIRCPWHLSLEIGWHCYQDYPFDREKFLVSEGIVPFVTDKFSLSTICKLFDTSIKISFVRFKSFLRIMRVHFASGRNFVIVTKIIGYSLWFKFHFCVEYVMTVIRREVRLESFNSKKITKWSFICLLWMLENNRW